MVDSLIEDACCPQALLPADIVAQSDLPGIGRRLSSTGASTVATFGDSAKTLTEFGQTVRDKTDLDKLTARPVEVVQETMQPAHVSLWLRESGRAQGRKEQPR